MAEFGLFLDIQLLYNQLTKTEKKIADYVRKNANQVLFMSITELRTHVRLRTPAFTVFAVRSG